MEFEIREENIDGIERWIWPKIDEGLWLGPMLDWRGHHKQKILQHCKNFRVAVQAGGGAGMYPRLLSNFFTYVYTFEPDADTFHCLTQNCYGRRIIQINAAVGENKSLVSLNRAQEVNLGTNTTEEKGYSYIPQITIDSFKFPACDLLWLDIEGAELPALNGAMETISTHNPVIMVEHGDRCAEFLGRLGYETVDHSVSDTLFVREKPPNP